jgi:hypothetical protein
MVVRLLNSAEGEAPQVDLQRVIREELRGRV